jgi:hypothetical protein
MRENLPMSEHHPAKGEVSKDAGLEVVRAYHEQELGRLAERVRAALTRLDAGEIDVFEFDSLVHQYKKAAQQLWGFCNAGTGRFEATARIIEEERERGEATDWWWELAAPRRR